MKIRQATIEDLDKLTELFDAYRVWYRKESNLLGSKAFLEQRIRLGESNIFIAFANDEAIGFTQLYPSFSSTKLKRLWILNDLYIKEAFRGQGISKLIIAKAKEFAIKTAACGILLETETSNSVGNKLYPSTGFQLEENNFYFWTNKNVDK